MTASPQSLWKSKHLEIGTPTSPSLGKRKRMTARIYKSLFKRLRNRDAVPDVDGELEGSDNLSHGCNDINVGIVSEPMEQTMDVGEEYIRRVVGTLRDETIDKASEGASQTLTGSLRGYENNIPENGRNVDPNLMKNAVDEPPHGDGLKELRTSSGVGKIFDDSERLPPNSSRKNKDAPVSAINAAGSKNCSLLEICVLCSKQKRIGHNSQEKELCFCNVTGEDLGNLSKLKEIEYGSTFGPSKFFEYWVPVQISNHQLEQYCATLISNAIPLCYCSRNDKIGVLRDILLAARKCCDHPYLVDTFVQEHMFAEGRSAHELLDVGIKASGKLQLLDMMLTQVKTRGLRVLILFQSMVRSGWASIGDILDDFLLQRFGKNSYVRVDAGVSPSTKQTAVNRFNRETGQFVFLLENRACSSTIKLLKLDIIVLYNSDWNPANDLKALQKISIDLAVNQVKVFRLYSSCTLEERALVLAKQNLNLDNNLQNLSRATSDSLLMWGARHLFSKLDDYHAESSSDSDIMSGQLLLNRVTKEIQSILLDSCEKIDLDPVISRAKLNVGSYSTNIPMLGEGKVQLKDGEEPHGFWRNLLHRRSPQWKHLRGQHQRNRKRVQYVDGSFDESDIQNDYAVKKHKRVVIEDVDPASVQEEEKHASSDQQQSLHSSLQGEDIEKETSTDTVGGSSISSFKLNVLIVKAKENSTYEEHCEDQSLLQEKLILEDKGTSSELDNMINDIKKKCDKRMKKLTRKQQMEIREFHQIWEEERSKLERDHKLESVIIRSLYGEGPSRLEKLNLLDSKFAKKMEEHNLLKDDQLKDLEAQHLAARYEEMHKAARWLAEAKACCFSELRAGHETLPPGPQSEKDAACSSSNTHILDVRDEVSTRQQHVEDEDQSEGECMQGNVVAQCNTSVSASAEEAGDSYPIGTPSIVGTTNPHNEVGESSAVIGQLNQPKHVGTVESICGNLPGERVSDEMQSFALKLPENEIVDYVNPVGLSNASGKEICKGDIIGQPDALVNPRDWTNRITTSDLALRGQILEPSEQTKASPNHHDLFQSHVPEDQIHENLVSVELQGQGAQPLEKQNTFQFKVAAQELVDAVAFSPSNVELQDQDAPEAENQSTSQIDDTTAELTGTFATLLIGVDAPVLEVQGTFQLEVADYKPAGTVTPVQPCVETQVIENDEQQQNLVSSDASATSNQSPAKVVESQTDDLGRKFSQTAKVTETEVLLHESASQVGESSEIHTSDLDIGSVSGVANETTVEPSASSPNNVAMPQLVLTDVELPDQAFEQLVIDVVHLSGSRYPCSLSNDQIASWNAPSLVADPLQYELEKMSNEAAQLQKDCKDMASRLKSDCEKWIQEIIAQMRSKYQEKLHDAELEFRLKKKELDTNHNKVLMNKMLAGVLDSICLDPLSSGLPEVPQGIPFSSPQRLHQLLQQSVQFHPAYQPIPHPQIAIQPTVQLMQQQTLPHSMRPFPITHQNAATQPVQVLQHAVALSSGTTSRPPVINAISPTGNLYFGGETHAPAPHIQAFRPASLPSIPPPQQLLFPQPPPPPLPLTSQSMDNHPRVTSTFHPFAPHIHAFGPASLPSIPPPQQLLFPQPPPLPLPLTSQNMDNHPRVTSTFHPLEPSY